MCLGIPGQIVAVQNAQHKIALVDVGGVTRPANIACVIDADNPIERCIGQWVLIHVGFAMARLDETEARETLKLLTELGEVQGELAAMAASGAA